MTRRTNESLAAYQLRQSVAAASEARVAAAQTRYAAGEIDLYDLDALIWAERSAAARS